MLSLLPQKKAREASLESRACEVSDIGVRAGFSKLSGRICDRLEEAGP
jgi:hypothetical protein